MVLLICIIHKDSYRKTTIFVMIGGAVLCGFTVHNTTPPHYKALQKD